MQKAWKPVFYSALKQGKKARNALASLHPWGRGTAIVVEGGCRLWRHIKLTVKGDISPPLSVSENKSSTQPAAVRYVPFFICREAATTTLSP